MYYGSKFSQELDYTHDSTSEIFYNYPIFRVLIDEG